MVRPSPLVSRVDYANLITGNEGLAVNQDAATGDLGVTAPNNIDSNISEIGGQAQSAVDVADAIDQIEDALTSVGTDQLRVDLQTDNIGLLQASDQPFDVSAATVTVTDNGALDVNSLPEPLDVSAAEVDVDVATNTAGLLTSTDQPLDVSGATVTVTDNGALDVNSLPEPLDVSSATVPTEQQTPVGVEDSGGSQIDPAQSVAYPDNQTVEHDLFNTGDLTVTVSLARAQAVIISANSVDSGSWSASIEWVDGTGNVFRTQSAADIGLSGSVNDTARLYRKGPQATITFTDESGAQNRINAYVGAHK